MHYVQTKVMQLLTLYLSRPINEGRVKNSQHFPLRSCTHACFEVCYRIMQ